MHRVGHRETEAFKKTSMPLCIHKKFILRLIKEKNMPFYYTYVKRFHFSSFGHFQKHNFGAAL